MWNAATITALSSAFVAVVGAVTALVRVLLHEKATAPQPQNNSTAPKQ